MRKLTLIIIVNSSAILANNKLSSGGSHYKSNDASVQSFYLGYSKQLQWSGSDKYQSGLSLSLNQSIFKNEAEDKSIAIGETEQLTIVSPQIEYNQNLGVSSTVGFFASTSQIKQKKLNNSTREDDSHMYGIRYTQWWLSDTIRSTFEARKNVTKQESQDFTATDGVRIITPSQLEGTSYIVDISQFVSTSTIIGYGGGISKRTDRPDAWSAQFQLRQYFDEVNGAAHIGFAHYRNVGTIKPITVDGEVVANSIDFSWNQKFADQWVLVPAYRFYIENHNPREFDARKEQIGSDYINLTLRYRFKKASWTENVSEASMLLGHYDTNKSPAGIIVGLGASILF